MTQAAAITGLAPMPVLRTMVVDGVTVEMTDTATQIVDRALKNLMDRVTKAERDLKAEFDAFELFKKKKEEMEEEGKKKVEAKDGEIAGLKKQLADAVSPEKIDALVRDRIAVITTGKKILGDKLVVDGKTDADIRLQVVASKLGDAAVKDKSAEYIRAAFDAVSAGVKDSDPLATAFSSPVAGGTTQNDAAVKAYDKYLADLGDAWKPKAA